VATSPTAPPRAAATLTLVALVGAEFLLQLDGTVLNVAVPEIQQRFGVGITTGSWVLNAFYLVFGGFLLLAGRLGDVLGHRRVFLTGIGLLTAASLLAGLAPTLELLLLGRGMQGLGAALAGPTALALLTALFDGEHRARAFAVYSTVTGLGAATGMILGGALTSAAGWRWAILVNVPLGLAILAVARAALPWQATGEHRSIGVLSAILVTAGLGSGVYGLVHAAETGWSDPLTLGALGTAAILIGVLVGVDRRQPDPLLPGRIFRHRVRLGGILALLLLAATLGAYLFFLAQYLAEGLGFPPILVGAALLPFAAALLLGTQIVNRFLGRLDLPLRGVLGLVVLAAGLGWLSLVDDGAGYPTAVLPALVVIGVGVGVAIVPFNLLVLTSADPADTGVTAGIAQSALTLGGLVGIAVLLLPFTGTTGETAPYATAFAWCAGTAVVGVLLAVGVWFGPGSRQR
jgi:EmrB/QacA subfamily drug resistance transporter